MSDIDNYLSKLSNPKKEQLERVRDIVRNKVPDATEVISYGMPVFKYNGKYLIGFSPFKDHMSLFPGASVIEALKDKLSEYKLSKGTIQFTAEKPVPESIIRELLELRLEAILG